MTSRTETPCPPACLYAAGQALLEGRQAQEPCPACQEVARQLAQERPSLAGHLARLGALA